MPKLGLFLKQFKRFKGGRKQNTHSLVTCFYEYEKWILVKIDIEYSIIPL